MKRRLAILTLLLLLAGGSALWAPTSSAEVPTSQQELSTEPPPATGDPSPPEDAPEAPAPEPPADALEPPAPDPPAPTPEPPDLPSEWDGSLVLVSVSDPWIARLARFSSAHRPAHNSLSVRRDRGAAPSSGLDPTEICDGAPDVGRCLLGIDLLNESCAARPRPGACLRSAASHACIDSLRSIECLTFLDNACGRRGTPFCILGEGLLEIYCAWTPSDRTLCDPGPTCCSEEPVGPDGPRFVGTGTLTSNPGGLPETIGIADPGATGDTGLEARPVDRDASAGRRERLALTGLSLLTLLQLGVLISLAGAGLRTFRT